MASLVLTFLSSCAPNGLPKTPLFEGVAGASYREGSRLIQARLEARFPPGSHGRDLAEYLQTQGLKLAADMAAPAEQQATFRYGPQWCGSQIRVHWQVDAEDRLESIDALYSDTGCP